ncbi:prepilin peptidase [Collibacillus ludicampi]|uniref:prepilin peptidase n=1 Tax=Collibacillus ludicampi TaxID=2771369 RepID=UPI0024947F2A|nr:prepilin peptidase [Collibacillus ludicampi]
MIQWLVLVFLAVAAWFDARTMRIPNRLQVIATFSVWLGILLIEPLTWKERLIISCLLSLFFLVFFFLGQSGAGDLKMMVWFGAGLGEKVWCILFNAFVSMVICYLILKIIKRSPNYVPLAPFLFIGAMLWIFTENSAGSPCL